MCVFVTPEVRRDDTIVRGLDSRVAAELEPVRSWLVAAAGAGPLRTGEL